MTAKRHLFLGVDGGATRSRACLRDGDGGLFAEAAGKAANIYVDFDAAIVAVNEVVAKALSSAGLERCEGDVALGLGLAGLQSLHDAAKVEDRFRRFRSVRATNDATIACLGAHGGGDGAIIIAGTGTAALVRIGGRDVVLGGRGFVLGDDGSAARIGHDALRAAVRAFDGIGPSSPLTAVLLGRFRGDAGAAVAWAASAKPGDFGALSPIVLEHAREADPVALRVVSTAVEAIAALKTAAEARGARRIALVGGLGPPLRSFMSLEVAKDLLEPEHDPVEGAVILAGGRLPDRSVGSNG